MALAHVVGDKVEAAYRRGDLFEKRRNLAEAWARYCDTLPSEGNRPVAIGARAHHLAMVHPAGAPGSS